LGDLFTLWVDGVAGGSFTLAGSLLDNATAWNIGTDNSNAIDFIGYIDEVRYTRGIARYTETFTPPEAAFPTAQCPEDPEVDIHWDRVSLLLHFTGTQGSKVTTDSGPFGHNVSITETNMEIETVNTIFAGTSCLEINTKISACLIYGLGHTSFDMGAGDFTLEQTHQVVSLSGFHSLLDYRGAANAQGYAAYIDAGTELLTFVAGDSATTATWEVTLTSTTTFANNDIFQWAVVREGNVWSLYIDGVREATTTVAMTIGFTGVGRYMRFGSDLTGFNGGYGRYDEIRITKGVARYSGPSYTPRTTPFPDS
jgi:hypothetical protein